MNEQRPTAILLFARLVKVDKDKIIKTLRHFHPEECGDAKFIGGIFSSVNHLKLLVQGKTVTINLVGKALPEQVWRPAAENWCIWDKAVETCVQHRFHIAISIIEPTAKLPYARLASAVAGAVALSCGEWPVAGLWRDDISILNSGQRFAELACFSLKPAPEIPTGLWTIMLSYTDHEAQSAIILTVGLANFGHLELEFDAPLAHQKLLAEQCRSIISHLVEHEGEQLLNGAQFAIPKICWYVIVKRASDRFKGISVYHATINVISDQGNQQA